MGVWKFSGLLFSQQPLEGILYELSAGQQLWVLAACYDVTPVPYLWEAISLMGGEQSAKCNKDTANSY